MQFRERAIQGVVAILLLGLITALFVLLFGRGSLHSYRDQLRARGEKLTPAELEFPAGGRFSDVQRFEELASQLSGSDQAGEFSSGVMQRGPSGVLEPVWTRAAPPGDRNLSWDDLQEVVDRNAEPLAEIRSLLAEPSEDRGFTLLEVIDGAPKNPLMQKRIVAQAFVTSAMIRLRQGNPGGAAGELHALAGLARLHRNEATLVNQMFRMAIANLGISATWEWLHAPDLNSRDLTALHALWSGFDAFNALNLGLEGERVAVLQVFEDLRSSNPSQAAVAIFLWPDVQPQDRFFRLLYHPAWRVAFTDVDEEFYLRAMQAQISAARAAAQPGAAAVPIWEGAENEIVRVQNQIEHWTGRRYWVSSAAIPNASRALKRVAQIEMLRRMTVTAIALRRAVNQHGAAPVALEELVPEFLPDLLLDPMDGKPFKYRALGGRAFLLYSAGLNGVDDGGDGAAPAGSRDLWASPDFVWRMENQ